MRLRDCMERGSRRGMHAANRSHAPSYFDSDDDFRLLSGMRTRACRQHDEHRDVDDMGGIQSVRFPFYPYVNPVWFFVF